MPRFYSREFPRPFLRIIDGEILSPDPSLEPGGIEIPGHTLRELIANLETMTDLRLSPADPPKYFLCTNIKTGDEELVDIHIHRHDEVICPKQDIDFLLAPDDVVEAGLLVC